jgi:hypothetical protein
MPPKSYSRWCLGGVYYNLFMHACKGNTVNATRNTTNTTSQEGLEDA